MQPPDVALTRMYNQPLITLENGKTVGAYYKSPIDCLWKTLNAEGFKGLYKGSTGMFINI